MGGVLAYQVERQKSIDTQKKILCDLKEKNGFNFPGSDYYVQDRKNWMSALIPEKLHVNKIVWPGTHDSATDQIGIPSITRPFAQCQSVSIYQQLKFLSETHSEIIILEIRTEFGHDDPQDFDKYLEDELGEFLIHQDDNIFNKTIAELLPKRVICVWKPRKSPQPKHGSPLWSSCYLKDNWIDTELPERKFENNMKYLSEQPPVRSRKFFYRVENTVIPQADNPVLWVKPVTDRIHPYARLFIKECISRGYGDRLQIFSSDFIDEDFVKLALVLQMQGSNGSSESEQMFTGLNSSINMCSRNFNYVHSLIRKQQVLLACLFCVPIHHGLAFC
ncbi:hypothetical protein RND71_035624 [Anisodus tanguticus]|uniref:Uncharacterized protein n=1 Tax=Anisodus tanguticus TaxID=243964 RepID=A0AAE1R5K9_9SOLA|nr:hypothetical protein RND71_035624 [Anisodus tanguticus]